MPKKNFFVFFNFESRGVDLVYDRSFFFSPAVDGHSTSFDSHNLYHSIYTIISTLLTYVVYQLIMYIQIYLNFS